MVAYRLHFIYKSTSCDTLNGRTGVRMFVNGWFEVDSVDESYDTECYVCSSSVLIFLAAEAPAHAL